MYPVCYMLLTELVRSCLNTPGKGEKLFQRSVEPIYINPELSVYKVVVTTVHSLKV